MIEPEKLYEKAMSAAEEWADYDHAAGLLEDLLSTVEGSIASRLKSEGESISIIPKLIKKDPQWKESASQWREAKKQALIAKLKYEQINRFMDNIRTKESTERALAR